MSMPLGLVRVQWTRSPDGWHIEIDLPPGMTADVTMPERTAQPRHLDGVTGVVAQLGDGRWRLTVPGGGVAKFSFPLAGGIEEG
jgi:hypothetical protein